MDMAEYMRNQRKEIPVSVNGEMLKINANFLLKINGTLLKFNESDMESLLKFNGNMLKINAEVLKINALKINENGEICEKTAFLANSAENSHVAGGGVATDVRLRNTDVDDNSSELSTLTDVVVKREDYKFNQTKEKNDFSKKNVNSQKNINDDSKPKKTEDEWKEIEKKAKPYWAIMPKECRDRSSFRSFVCVYNKLKGGKDVPELWVFFASIVIKKDTWREEYYPAAHNFLAGEPWNDFSADEQSSLERYKEDYQHRAEKLVAAFCGRREPSRELPTETRSQSTRTNVRKELPTLAEWDKFSMQKQFDLANHLGWNRSQLEEEIKRRSNEQT